MARGRREGSVFRGTDSDDALFWLAGDRIVFSWEKDGWTHLYAIAVSGGAPKLLTPGEFEVENVWSDGRTIVYSSNEGDIDRRHVWKSDGVSKPVALTSGKSIEWDPVVVDGTVACFRSDATHPGRVVILSGAKDPCR